MYNQKAVFGMVLALMIMASALAMWNETLRVNVSVSMGDVDWKFQKVEWLDACDSTSGKDWNVIPPSNEPKQVDKDVGCTSVSISEDGHTLDITLSNVYPWYYTEVKASIVNTGTIPIKVSKLTIDGEEYPPTSREIYLDINNDHQPDLLIMWEGPEYCEQIHPGQSTDLVIKVLVLQNAPQGLTTSISVGLTAIQWNELTCPPPTTTTPTYKPTIDNGNFTGCSLNGWSTDYMGLWQSATWSAVNDDEAKDGCAAKFDGKLTGGGPGGGSKVAYTWLYQNFTVSKSTSFNVVIRYKVNQVTDSGASVTLKFGVWNGSNWVCIGSQTIVRGTGPDGRIPYHEYSVPDCSLTPGSYQLRLEIENNKSNNFVMLVDYFTIDC